ncbi:hypothetical protein C1646_776909 [Rhizophagus diaphanus]|nr:hypothetical protein C1646_776909 [Rhizophagus diaphanus] [Rhizophagus sp. MUCL 43196]
MSFKKHYHHSHFVVVIYRDRFEKCFRRYPLNENLVLNELADAFQDLNLLYQMQAKEFFNLPEENIVYKVPEDNKIVYLFKNTNKENIDLKEIDDSDEFLLLVLALQLLA